MGLLNGFRWLYEQVEAFTNMVSLFEHIPYPRCMRGEKEMSFKCPVKVAIDLLPLCLKESMEEINGSDFQKSTGTQCY